MSVEQCQDFFCIGEELTYQRTHREVMNWLKEWDKCVFKRAAPSKKRKAGAEEEESPYVSCCDPEVLSSGGAVKYDKLIVFR